MGRPTRLVPGTIILLTVVLVTTDCGSTVTVFADDDDAAAAPASGGGGAVGGEDVDVASSSSGTSGTVDATPACVSYCDLIEDKGCFSTEQCLRGCMDFYVEGCTAQVEAVLACVPDHLVDGDCRLRLPPGYGACDDAMWSLRWCASDSFQDLGFKCSLMGSTIVGSDSSSCRGYTDCVDLDLDTECQAGHCTCSLNSLITAECSTPFTGIDVCFPDMSCCRQALGY